MESESPVTRAVRRWNEGYVYPFSLRYNNAYKYVTEKIKEDHEQRKATAQRNAELVVLALTIAGGGLGVVAFGAGGFKSGLGALINRRIIEGSALNLVVKRNSEVGFKVLDIMQNNAAVLFLAGTTYDEVMKKVSGSAVSAIKATADVKSFIAAVGADPLSTKTNLERLLNRLAMGANEYIDELNKMPDGTAKAEAFAAFENGAFMRGPPKIDEDLLEKKIILALWMQHVLEHDFVKTSKQHFHQTKHGGQWSTVPGTTKLTPISQTPGGQGRNAYPKALNYTDIQRFRHTEHRVVYKDTSEAIDKLINQAHKAIYKSNFFNDNPAVFSFDDYEPIDKFAIMRADLVLRDLMKGMQATR